MTYFGEGFAWGPGVGGDTIQISSKTNLFQKNFQIFSLHFKSTFH